MEKIVFINYLHIGPIKIAVGSSKNSAVDNIRCN